MDRYNRKQQRECMTNPQYPFEDNLYQSMYYPLQSKFLETVHTLCGRIPQVFLKQIEKTMKRAYERRVIVQVRPRHRL